MAPIAPVAASIAPVVAPAAAPAASGGGAFQSVLTDAIGKVEAFSQQALTATQNFLSGEGAELHSTIMAAQRAELTFDLFMQVRNKVVSAYQEVMKMQL